MPMRAPRICTCGKVVPYSITCECKKVRLREYERSRPSSSARGYGAQWRRERAEFLARPENRMCVCGCGRKANTIDHKKPHKGDPALLNDQSNWQPVYRNCNNRKAAKSEGAFGNPIRPGGGF